MEQLLFNYLHGYVRIRIVGISCDRFWNLCAYHGIHIWDLSPVGEDYEACVSRSDFFRLKTIVRKCHTRIRITRRYGLPFFLRKYRNRWASVVGALTSCLFIMWLSSHIWNISVEGNVSQSDDVVFEYLENEGVSHGMWKNQIDTLELSEQIRNYFSRFSWVSVELKGTRLLIYVKEGIGENSGEKNATVESETADSLVYLEGGLSETDAEGDESASGIAAAKAGTVISIYVRKGLAAVSPGDVVEAGELLVSGQIPIHNDDGEVISWKMVSSDADIVLRTETEYYDTLEYEVVLKKYTGREQIRCTLRAGNYTFALPGVWQPFEKCDFTGEMTQLKLSENFYLPIYFCKYTAKEYENLPYTFTEEQAEEILETNLSLFLKKLEEKGVQIFQNNVTIDLYENTAVASGVLITDESAVIRAVEKIEEQQEEYPQE